jgi:hypothetical protein
MMILISSRLVFTFSDISDTGKNAVSIVLIIFLILVLLRTVGDMLRRKLTGNDDILITPGMLQTLEFQDRTDVGEVLTDYQILYRNRVMQIDQEFAMNSKAAKIFMSFVKISNPNQATSRVRVVSIPFSDLPKEAGSPLPKPES